MSKAPLIARILLRFIFFGAGLAGLLNLAPPPEDTPEKVVTFFSGMMATTYFFPLLKGTETLCGFLLLSGWYVPLALIVLAPIILSIFLLHAFLQPSGVPLAFIIGGLEIYLAFFAGPYCNIVRGIFVKKA